MAMSYCSPPAPLSLFVLKTNVKISRVLERWLSAVLPEDPGPVPSTHKVVYSLPVLGDPKFSSGPCTHAVHVLGQNVCKHLKKKSSSKFKMCFLKNDQVVLLEYLSSLNFLYMLSGEDSDITQTMVCPCNKAIFVCPCNKSIKKITLKDVRFVLSFF